MTKKILDFIEIKDTNGKKYLGGDQHWYKNKFHALSGCGPTVASEILAYLARENPKKCGGLYAFDIKNIDADDFVLHMDSVREYVKPGIKGLTSVSFFESSSKEFALNRGVKLYAKKTSSKLEVEIAFNRIKKTIDKGYPLALLILRNPYKEIEEYTWHWMSVIGYDDENMNIIISTYGEKLEFDFKHVWHQTPSYRSELICFRQEES